MASRRTGPDAGLEVPSVRDEDPPPKQLRRRLVDHPEPGFFLIRRVKNGPWLPARIVHDFGGWGAFVDGKQSAPYEEDPLKAREVLNIWHYGREIDEAEYQRRLRRPVDQRPDPHKPFDLRKTRSVF